MIASSSVPPMLILTPISAWIFIYPSVSELIWIALSLNCNWVPRFNNKPVSGTCVNVTSWSLPNLIKLPSAKNKSENPLDEEPNVVPLFDPGVSELPDNISCLELSA